MDEIIANIDPTTAQKAFWTTKELADRWRLRPRTIRRHAHRGLVSSIKIGGRHRIPNTSVQDIEARGIAQPQVQPEGLPEIAMAN